MIPPGGSGQLVAKVTTRATQRGRLTKAITVVTDAPGGETLRLTMTMDVEPLIDQAPDGTAVLRAAPGEGARAEIRLARRDGQPLAATGVRLVDEKLLRATVRQEGPETVVEIELVPQTELIETATKVQVITGMTELPLWMVPVRIWVQADPGKVAR